MPKDNNDIIGLKTKAVPVKPKEIGIDTTDNFTSEVLDAASSSELDMSILESFSTVAQTREEVYNLIDTMSQDDKVSSILETYAEDIVETNDEGKVVWCDSSDEKVAKYVTYLLDSLNVDKNIYSWAFKLVKYGDLYLRLYRESDYGDDLLFGDDTEEESKKPLKEDVKLHIKGKDDHFVHYVEAVDNPGEMFELTKFGKTMAFIKASTRIMQNYDKNSVGSLNPYLTYKMQKNDVNIYPATEYVHAALEDNSGRTPEKVSIFTKENEESTDSNSYTVRRGQSLLYNTFKIWRELTLLENSVLLNRLTKSAIVRILNVDVGDMPKEQVQNFMDRLKAKIEQKSALNVGESMAEYTNPGPIENIIYVPTHGTQGQITAQAIGGDVDPKQLTDLDRFTNEFYGAFRIPKAYFGWTDDGAGFNGGQSLSIISARYGKAVKRIQNTLCQCITDLINIFLLDKGLKSYINRFVIRMQAPVTQEELDRRENMRNIIGVNSDAMNLINSVVTDEVLKVKIVKELLSSCIGNPNVIALLQEQIDMMENPEEENDNDKDNDNKEDKKDKRPKPIGSSGPSEPSEGELFDNISEPEEEIPTEEPFETPEEGEEIIEPTNGEDSYLPNPAELGLDLTNNEQ